MTKASLLLDLKRRVEILEKDSHPPIDLTEAIADILKTHFRKESTVNVPNSDGATLEL